MFEKALLSTKKEIVSFLKEIWYSEDIEYDYRFIGSGFKIMGLKGIPLEMTRSYGKIRLKTFATAITTESLDDALFKLDTQGYTEVPWKKRR